MIHDYDSYMSLVICSLPSFQLHFSDGAGRTGTYIAISNILERMKIEQAVDVFQSIKIIRGARPQFVENAVSTSFLTKYYHHLSLSRGRGASGVVEEFPKQRSYLSHQRSGYLKVKSVT